MKKINIAYWIFTILFVLAMLTTAIPELINNADAAKFMTNLGYPSYMNRFLGVAKVLGVVALLVPGFPRIKEWAYAGMFFDLVGATFSIIAVGTPASGYALMSVWFILLFASYYFYHRRLAAAGLELA